LFFDFILEATRFRLVEPGQFFVPNQWPAKEKKAHFKRGAAKDLCPDWWSGVP
jgi:hypothetical protein